jgi:hypothetical protein
MSDQVDRSTSPEKLERRKKRELKAILETIAKYNLFTVTDIFAYHQGISRGTFYNWRFDEVDEIKAALELNKTRTKRSILRKWAESDNPTCQMALVKLTATDEERRALSLQYNEHKGEVVHKLMTLDPLADGDDGDQDDTGTS